MGGDYTRWTFNPANDYAEVFKQQGRVDLDGDWNELVEILYRRWRAETIDMIGRAVVPESTPNAFLITPAGPGQFTIGIGRMYVDGLLAECHGLSPLVFDPSLGELDGTTPIPFTSQPYYPNPNPLPTPGPSVDLMYLDVWQREVSALQDPIIREKALGGPDTTTRSQTVWQVKILPNVGAHACGDDIASWDTLVAPSAGRLTTSTVAPTPSPDPCILSPTGGYRGLENRLYRVEVHTAGTVGGANPATFKWSRDNASVVSGVNAISASGGPNSVVTLTSLGRDQVLRFKAGDWVEILDDETEFSASDFDGTNFVGKPGFLTQISAPPDEAHRTITVTPAIPAGLFDPTAPTRHTRARRWDQQFTGAGSDVDPTTGLITVAAGPLDIEDGIQVSFSDDPAGGLLHVGDYWLFAARTADGSVEPLQKAPPRGILHHYARLGFMTWAAGGSGTFQDCRQIWPPAQGDCTGCCTVTVGDGVNSHGEFINDIQGAIDSLGAAGGEVCLGRGVFLVRKGIVLDNTKKNVTIRGMGWATKIIFVSDAQTGVLFTVTGTSHVILESFFAVARMAQSIVRIANSRSCVVRDTALINLNISAASQGTFLGTNAAGITRSGRAIELLENGFDIQIERNTLIAAKSIVSGTAVAAAVGGITGTVSVAFAAAKVPLPNATLTLTDSAGNNQTTTSDQQGQYNFSSLAVGGYSLACSASGFQTATNSVTVVANTTVTVDFAMAPGNAIGSHAAAPAAVAAATTITSNLTHLLIRENFMLSLLSGIFLAKAGDCDILSNQLLGLNAETIKALQGGDINRNNIDAFQNRILAALTTASSTLAFQGAGIILFSGTRVTIADNQITGLLGIMAVFLSEARVRDNQVLAFLGALIFDGLLVRITGNFVAGLFAGFLQAGLLVDFLSDSNLWLGLSGMVFMPLTIFQKQFAPLFSAALQKGGFAASGSSLLESALNAVNSTGANLGSIGLVAVAKIHHDVFFTFQTGILAESGILSGDVTIADNSFEVCAAAAIRWISLPLNRIFGTLLQPVHVIERNTMNVTGAAVICRCVDGVFRGNTIRCAQLGMALTCFTGLVQGNSIAGTATSASTNGLVTLLPLSLVEQPSSFRVIGNRLQDGAGHGILIDGNFADLTVEDNFIINMAQSGIITLNTAVLQNARISRNDIVKCQAGRAIPPFDGALILWEVISDLAVDGNRILGNKGIGMNLNLMGDVKTVGLCLRAHDNSVDGDGDSPMIIGSSNLVQFIGNQCTEPQTQQTPVTLRGHLVVANGNTIYSNQIQSVPVPSLLLIAVGPSPPAASAIATSNILNGAPQNSGFSPARFVANNNLSI